MLLALYAVFAPAWAGSEPTDTSPDAADDHANRAQARADEKAKRRESKTLRKPPTEEKIAAWLAQAEITRASTLSAILHTEKGDIRCELLADKAPLTVANFVALAEGKKPWMDAKTGEMVNRPLYDGVVFHRVIRSFMIQSGDPEGTGKGYAGYRFEDETRNGLEFDAMGLLAMANSGPGTNSSQFFITVKAAIPYLDDKHTIFGRCDTETAIAISKIPTTANRPNTDVVIQTIEIVR